MSYHTCAVCNTAVERHAQALKDHLATHGFTVANYFNTHVRKRPEAQELEPEADGDGAWMLGCRVTCRHCWATFPSKKEHCEHLESSHAADASDVPHPASKRLFFCQVCSVAVDHDPDDIATHLMEQHFLTPDSYRQQYMAQVQAQRSRQVSGNQNQSQIPDQQQNQQQNQNQNGFAARRRLHFQWNQNPIRCYICTKVSTSKHTLNQHFANIHKMPFDSKRLGESGPQIAHKCRVCHKSYKMETTVIKGHLATHKMDIYEYEARFFEDLKREFDGLQSASELEASVSASNGEEFVAEVFDLDPSSVDSSIIENEHGPGSNGLDDEDAAIELDFEQLLQTDVSQIAAASTEGIEMEYFNVPPLAGPQAGQTLALGAMGQPEFMKDEAEEDYVVT